MAQRTLMGIAWAAVAITVWSGSLVLLRLGMTTHLNAYDLTALRFGVAALILAPVVLRQRTGADRSGSVAPVAMVIAFGAPYILLLALAMNSAPASAAGALNPGVMAVASLVLARIIFADRIGVARLMGLVTTLAGIVLFTRSGAHIAIGHLLIVGTGIMWAGYAAIVRYTAIPALNATAIVAVGSAVCFLPVYWLALPKQIFVAPLEDVLLQAGFQGVLVSVVAIYAFNRSAELLGPVAGATLPALIPVVTLGLGVLVLGEIARLGEVVSAVLVTLGVVLILIGKPLR